MSLKPDEGQQTSPPMCCVCVCVVEGGVNINWNDRLAEARKMAPSIPIHPSGSSGGGKLRLKCSEM